MSGVATAIVGAAVIGAVVSSSASNKANATARAGQAAQQSVEQQQLDLAHEQWNRYKDTYGPLEDEYTNEARDYASEANRQKAAEEAAGDVTASYAGLRSQLNATPGLDPSSQKYLDLMGKLGVSQAAQTAASETGARRNVDAQGMAKMQDALSIGKGLPGQASATLNGAAATAASVEAGANQQSMLAGQNATNVGRMFGNLATNPQVQQGVKSWFSGGMTGPGADINTDPSSELAQNGSDVNTEVFSDRRLKTDIEKVGQRADGLSVYEYRYVWGGPTCIGLMADEVAAVYPDAVRRHPSGFLMVDYAKV